MIEYNHVRLYLSNSNRDRRFELPQAWKLTIKKQNWGLKTKRTSLLALIITGLKNNEEPNSHIKARKIAPASGNRCCNALLANSNEVHAKLTMSASRTKPYPYLRRRSKFLSFEYWREVVEKRTVLVSYKYKSTSTKKTRIEINPAVTLMSDQDRNSPYNINTISSRLVMRILKNWDYRLIQY